ncbi:MAG: GNAT family N-acetyltransferase [Solirubrobacteraceae bacterium]
MPAESTSSESLATVLDFQRRTTELVADEVLDIDEGWIARTPSLSDVWSLNHVRVDRPIAYEQAEILCRRYLPPRFDQLYVDDQAGGESLAEEFRDQGWEIDVEVHSVLVRSPDRPPGAVDIIEPGEDETLALMERWLAEDETLHLTEEGLRQLVVSNRLTWRARHARRLGVRGPGGELVAMTLVFSDGQVAQVEDVYTVPEARGHGHARALVTRAAELARGAGHELTFIVADDNDWPKELYAKVGFEAVGRTWLLHRPLSR